MKKSVSKVVLFVLVLILIAVNYSWLDSSLEEVLDDSESVEVVRVIDGDTIEVEDNRTVRLLGINTPERGEEGYEEAKEFLIEKVLNKSVVLKYGKEGEDMYGRTLAYVYLNGNNVNAEIVSEGYGNLYFPSGKDMFYVEMNEAWETCVDKGVGVCEKSSDVCGECVEVKDLDYVGEEVVLENICSFDCDLDGWHVKDEGRKKYYFDKVVLESGGELVLNSGEGVDEKNLLFWNRKDYVWTDSGDTIFVYDDKNDLVFWESY